MIYLFNHVFGSGNTNSSKHKLGAQNAAKQVKNIFLPIIFLHVSIYCATSEINLSTDALVAWISLTINCDQTASEPIVHLDHCSP